MTIQVVLFPIRNRNLTTMIELIFSIQAYRCPSSHYSTWQKCSAFWILQELRKQCCRLKLNTKHFTLPKLVISIRKKKGWGRIFVYSQVDLQRRSWKLVVAYLYRNIRKSCAAVTAYIKITWLFLQRKWFKAYANQPQITSSFGPKWETSPEK